MVPENSASGTSVTTVQASDADSHMGEFGSISYALQGVVTEFSIAPDTGVISVDTMNLDRESISQYTFSVIATDYGTPSRSATAEVVVTLTDINDNSPQFQQLLYRSSIREDAAVQSEVITVLATDADEPGNNNSVIDYSIINTSVFAIASNNGTITLASALNFEEMSSHMFTVVATDRGLPMLNGTATVIITVVNVNDEPPMLNRNVSQNLNLSELTPIQTEVIQYTVIAEGDEVITFSLNGSQSDDFAIDSMTGAVTVAQSLDYETTQFYSLNVFVDDGAFVTTSQLNITVLDENDNVPQFNAIGVLQIDEERLINTSIGQVSATDADSGVNREITYSFVQSSTANLFTINPVTGEIITATVLDRESLVQQNLFLLPMSQVTFQVQASDAGTPTLFSQVDVTVQLNDINDNPPIFDNPVATVDISESASIGTQIAAVTANDIDVGENARVVYSLSGSTLFSINSSSGEIFLNNSLDYELSPQHTIIVTAANPDGTQMATHSILIRVTDENDNSPEFAMPLYTATVVENSDVGTPVINVSATDADSGILGEVRYSIMSGNDDNLLAINSATGTITINDNIDREVISTITLSIVAADLGNVPRNATVTVTITVADVNDNIPVFSPQLYELTVVESAESSIVIATVAATDADVTAPNNQITYLLESDSSPFTISQTGQIGLENSSMLDFETQEMHSFVVLAVDKGMPSLTGTADVVVNVINVNDLPPVLNGDSSVTVSESTSVNSRITQFTATGEEGETLTFSLNSTSPFSIDAQSGAITVSAQLDYEITTFYNLLVTVSDDEFNTSSPLLVNILDVNDNEPQIVSAGPFTFNEEIPVNTSIGIVMATDADSGENAQLTYILTQGGNLQLFSIDSDTGEIFTTTRIDRESLDRVNSPPNITITVMLQVTDNGSPALSAVADVEFIIIEINDNLPQFVNPINETEIEETYPVGDVITQVTATDADVGDDPIIYSITGSSLFSIDSTTGVITLAGSLDYETAVEHTIIVNASNPGVLASSSHLILVRVINVNDNSPLFTLDYYTALILEGSDVGTFVVNVVANDADLETFGMVQYSIVGGNVGDAFAIQPDSGMITVNNSNIDRETTDMFVLPVTAADRGIPSRSSQSMVIITIGDVNDNSPVFIPPSYTAIVPENVLVNFLLISVTATDADIPPNSDITYRLPSSVTDNSFTVSSNGSFFTASTLDFETIPSYMVAVEAVDHGDPQLTGMTLVTVLVLDVNDQVPSLVGDEIVAVSESASIGSVVSQFRVQREEAGDVITFELSGVMSETFAIDNVTGLVTVAQELDFETTPIYDLLVTVNDGIFNSSTGLRINVQDENDNLPVFQEFGPFTLMEELPNNTVVGRVVATDADSGENSNLNFTIIRNVANLFTINRTTGEIFTNTVLDRESLVLMNFFVPPDSQQSITVQAEDNGSPSLFAQTMVDIILVDINDNSPDFISFEQNLALPENIRNNTVIAEVLATDSDLDVNGIVVYSIPDTSVPFSINSSTGVVTTASTLDRETVDFYQFQIVASDNGQEARSASVQITINVTDVNDNPPVFQGTPYMDSVPENAATDGGSSFTLLTVTTTDQDIGVNAEVTYSLGPGTSSVFNIRNATGEFRVSGGINFEDQNEFNVTVIATDGGLPALTSTTIVNVMITNVDEFAPRFFGPCDANVSESASLNTIVTQCLANDRDAGILFYQAVLTGNNPFFGTFTVGFETGEVFLATTLDRETIDQYQFTMETGSLLSVGENQLAQMEVTINVEDVNDNAPIFNPNTHAIPYENPSTVDIVTLSVTDDDINENGQFSLNITSVMRTNTTNDLDTHVIVVTAVDMGTPAMSGNATVTVTNQFPCQIMDFRLFGATINVSTLCSITSSESMNYTFGTPVQLNCSAISNLPVTYQWQLDGSFVTNQSSNAILDLGEVDFNDVGSYSCIARTKVGNIQSNTANIGVHTVPVIEGPPEDEAVELRRLVQISCFSSGVPEPKVTFYHNDFEVVPSSRVSQAGSFLVITSATADDEGTYSCEATNDAGTATSSDARLIVFDGAELVTTTLQINNPNEDRTCHNLDIDMIENILETSTNRGAEVIAAVAESSSFCEPNSCYPNPCKNRGRCTVNENSTEGYVCACPSTFTGINCQDNLNECATDNPCLFESNCTDTDGLFNCTCPQGREGHRCQYEIKCNDSICEAGETCVETVANQMGFQCVSTPINERLRIQLSDGISLNLANEALYDLTDRLLELDTNGTDLCEPRLISAGSFVTLVWGCPNGTDPLGIDAENLICKEFLNASLTTLCMLSDGTTQEPSKSDLEPIKVKVTFILHDLATYKALPAPEALAVLRQSGARTALTGENVESSSSFQAENAVPNTGSSDDELSGGAIAGIVIAVLAVLTVLILLAAYSGYKYYKNSNHSATFNNTLPTLRTDVEGGIGDRKQTVVGVFQNPAFVNGENGKSPGAGDDGAFGNPAYADTPVITKLEGITEPVGKGAISRITSEESRPSVSSDTALMS